ncbi:MAG: AraC family transcriptional regulator [Paenibacillus sp.]|jgi:AraC-like DNA-binding protein|nr:AraC family transcriptional regulator [Paenibacillus sp.]
MNRRYRHIELQEQLTITKIYSFHYTELNKNFVYSGEQHSFWEFLYVDKGEVEVTTDFATFLLKQGEIIFYSPDEFHSLKCNQKTPPNVFIIAFDCESAAMPFFSRKTFSFGDEERELLLKLLDEGSKLFKLPIIWPPGWKPDRKTHRLDKKEDPEFGCEQLIKMYLEALLIQIIRNNQSKPVKAKLSSITKEKSKDELIDRIIDYLHVHLSEHPTQEQICAEFALSKTHLRTVFREHTECGITEYIVNMRIGLAKQLIREETSNLTEISERLGYSSLHYFSRQFKKATGVSPSEYLKTMKARIAE